MKGMIPPNLSRALRQLHLRFGGTSALYMIPEIPKSFRTQSLIRMNAPYSGMSELKVTGGAPFHHVDGFLSIIVWFMIRAT